MGRFRLDHFQMKTRLQRERRRDGVEMAKGDPISIRLESRLGVDYISAEEAIALARDLSKHAVAIYLAHHVRGQCKGPPKGKDRTYRMYTCPACGRVMHPSGE